MRRVHALAAMLLALGAVACGDNDSREGSTAPGKPVDGQQRGGTLRVLAAEDVDSIDPGLAYFQTTYMITYATQRPLYSYEPEDRARPVPDFAARAPQVSADGRTVTVKLRRGVSFSPPVSREATSADVKYAIERAFAASVPNGYAPTYFGDLVGAPAEPGSLRPIRGIETPDPYTVVFRLAKPVAGAFVKALVLPVTAPVPADYARRFDAANPSTYGSHQVATGPYMIANDSRGNLTGYRAGRSITLVRNPAWRSYSDFRPAYVNRVEWSIGTDPNVAGRQILRGRDLINGDTPTAPVVKQAVTRRKDQIAFTTLGNRYITMNTKLAPFDDVNVRRAVLAAFDRRALAATRGGATVGHIANHFLYPGVPGFEEAGGFETDLDFLKDPGGNPTLAAGYLKKAGYPSGRYTGREELVMVGDNADPAAKTAQVALDEFRKLGFRVKLRSVSSDVMNTRFCGTPKAQVAICPNFGWLPDYNDPQAVLFAPFSGSAIAPENNTNWPQLDDPGVDAAMDRAALIRDDRRRAEAWGEIDRRITALAPAVPWFWDKTPNIQSSNVQGVIGTWNAAWDLSYTSLK